MRTKKYIAAMISVVIYFASGFALFAQENRSFILSEFMGSAGSAPKDWMKDKKQFLAKLDFIQEKCMKNNPHFVKVDAPDKSPFSEHLRSKPQCF